MFSTSQSRKSEIALLEQISTSLDTYIGENPSLTGPTTNYKKRSASDVSKNAAKNFLAAKTLVKSIAKSCAQEKVVAPTAEKSDGLFDLLVGEYKEKYPTLTKKMLLDGISRYYDAQDVDKSAAEEEDDKDVELKFGRIIASVDAEMNQYYEKVESIKRSRELAGSEPDLYQANAGMKRSAGASPKVAKARRKVKDDTPEDRLINDISKRYIEEKAKHGRLPNGMFETIVEEMKKQHGLESFDMPLVKLDKKIRHRYYALPTKNETDALSKNKFVEGEVYARYSRAKKANGGKLPGGTIDSIIEGVKLEYGLPIDAKLTSLKQKVQQRFTKENPGFESNPPGNVKIAELSEDDNKKRQLLMNEVTARYVKEKEGCKKLPDGTLDRIIEQTKNDLGIHEFEVPKASIRGRINRKSLHVQTLGSESPFDVSLRCCSCYVEVLSLTISHLCLHFVEQAIDEPLVTTINSWLSQGISVTRAQGLDLANRLLKGKGMAKDKHGQEIVLNAKWWKNCEFIILSFSLDLSFHSANELWY